MVSDGVNVTLYQVFKFTSIMGMSLLVPLELLQASNGKAIDRS